MTFEGRLARGKKNYDSNKFLKNPETLLYIESISKVETKPKENKKNALK